MPPPETRKPGNPETRKPGSPEAPAPHGPPRSLQAGLICQVFHSGNGRPRRFHREQDDAAFERVPTKGMQRYPVDLPTCRPADLPTWRLMPNHWHRVVRSC